MPSQNNPVFSVTSEGGPIGTITILHKNPLPLVLTLFRPKNNNASFKEGKLHYGWLVDGDEVLDEALVCLWRNHPRWRCSAAELHVHGGVAVVERLKRTLMKRGIGYLPVKGFPAFLWRRGYICALQREAEELLLSCRSPRGLLAALNWQRLKKTLLQILEKPEEEARKRLRELLETAPCGIAATRPKRFLLAGSPNAGKSSLFNALIERTRSIVHPEPGTTVDVVTIRIDIEGYHLFLSDSAGICEEKGLWCVAMDRLRKETKRCDFIIWLHDVSRPPSSDDILLQKALLGETETAPFGLDPRRIVPIMSKTDMKAVWQPRIALLKTSGKTKRGVKELRRLLLKLATEDKRWSLPCLFTPRQVSLCQRAVEAELPKMNRLIKQIVEGRR